ncbi:hypothetical protein, partial [Nocardia wallacei]|uniref:hypothetical protein n=1 Tax=Nocardia wallacei TaxID=480035 RepID=UPI002456B304
MRRPAVAGGGGGGGGRRGGGGGAAGAVGFALLAARRPPPAPAPGRPPTALYLGNPNAHTVAGALYLPPLIRAL